MPVKEIMFVNEYARSKETAKEIYGYWCFKRPVSIFGYVALGLYISMYLLSMRLGVVPNETTTILTFFLVAFYPMQYLVYVSRFLNQDKIINHGNPIRAYIVILDDKIFLGHNEDKDQYISIFDTKYAYGTKNYLVLVLKNRMLLILRKDGFTTGSLDGFLSHLTDKGIKIKGKKN